MMQGAIMVKLSRSGAPISEPRGQFLIDAVEAAIGEDGDHIARSQVGAQFAR